PQATASPLPRSSISASTTRHTTSTTTSKSLFGKDLIHPVPSPNSPIRPPLMTLLRKCPSHGSPNSRTTATTARSFDSSSRYSIHHSCIISVLFSENVWNGLHEG